MNRFHKMNRFFKSCLLASAGLVILAATLALTAPGRAFAQRVGEDCVRICDTASNPLHVIVQGITRVTGDVTINNENAIATTVTGPVQVSTSRGEPLLVVQRMKVDDIFQKQISLTLKPGDKLEKQDFVVPAGTFLEIKYASGTANIRPSTYGWLGIDSVFDVTIRVVEPGNGDINDFPLTKIRQGPLLNNPNAPYNSNNIAGFQYQIGGNPIQIFANAGSTVQVRFGRLTAYPNESNLELALSGEYHDD